MMFSSERGRAVRKREVHDRDRLGNQVIAVDSCESWSISKLDGWQISVTAASLYLGMFDVAEQQAFSISS